MAIRFVLLSCLLALACAGRLYLKAAGVGGSDGPDLQDGGEYCLDQYSATGVTVVCVPGVQDFVFAHFFSPTGERQEFAAPYTIAGDVNGRFDPWTIPTSNPVRITCNAVNSYNTILEATVVSVTFKCPMQKQDSTTSQNQDTATSQKLPIDPNYCVGLPAQSHYNARPAAWVENGTALTSWPNDPRADYTYPANDGHQLNYRFRVTAKSRYAITMRSWTKHSTEHNDCFIEFPYGLTLVGTESGKLSEKSGKTHAVKAYQNLAGFATIACAVDFNCHSFSTTSELLPGVDYEIVVHGRSTQFVFFGLFLFPCSEGDCSMGSEHFASYLGKCNVYSNYAA